MRVTMLMTAMAATAMLAGAAQAQTGTAPEGARYQAALERMITETAQGRCPADLMAEQLLTACNQQIAAMSTGLQSLGHRGRSRRQVRCRLRRRLTTAAQSPSPGGRGVGERAYGLTPVAL